MRPPSITALAAFTAATTTVFGAQLNVSIEGFADPQSFLDESLELRFTELVPAGGTNSSTHVLIEGLSPLADGSLEYRSTYSGIDVSTGAIQDSGVIYMTMPEGTTPPENSVISPIVGVVQRQGDWSITLPEFPFTDISDPTTGNTPAGTGLYDGSSLSINLSNGSDTFTGTADYSVLDKDTILLDPFVLTTGGFASYSMSEAILIRDGDSFFGTLINLEPDASYNSLIFSIDLDDIPDLDLDGIPDLSDPILMSTGSWSETAIGWVYSYSESVAYSLVMGWVNLENFPVIYHYELEWFQYVGAPASMGQEIWLYSPTLGWVYTQGGWNGDFYKTTPSGWDIDNFLSPAI